MNKLEGFYELKASGLPTVPWKRFEEDTVLDRGILWTIRTAVISGDDINLPRKVGVTAQEAEEFAKKLRRELPGDSMILYYPYFIAQKSGVLEVRESGIVIEAVHEDLWNLVTDNKVDVSIIISDQEYTVRGDEQFLKQDELLELIDYSKIVKKKYYGNFLDKKSIFLEWSYACAATIEKEKAGAAKLVFYELRTVEGI